MGSLQSELARLETQRKADDQAKKKAKYLKRINRKNKK